MALGNAARSKGYNTTVELAEDVEAGDVLKLNANGNAVKATQGDDELLLVATQAGSAGQQDFTAIADGIVGAKYDGSAAEPGEELGIGPDGTFAAVDSGATPSIVGVGVYLVRDYGDGGGDVQFQG